MGHQARKHVTVRSASGSFSLSVIGGLFTLAMPNLGGHVEQLKVCTWFPGQKLASKGLVDGEITEESPDIFH